MAFRRWFLREPVARGRVIGVRGCRLTARRLEGRSDGEGSRRWQGEATIKAGGAEQVVYLRGRALQPLGVDGHVKREACGLR